MAVCVVWPTPAAFAASIAIDVGHYFAEPGVISARGIPGFDYNPRLAREVSESLQGAGHKTFLIGDDGMMENLGSRAPRGGGMDLFISIHHDSVQPRFLSNWESGGETFYYGAIRLRARTGRLPTRRTACIISTTWRCRKRQASPRSCSRRA